MKYVDELLSFANIPGKITLCINISNCEHKCKGCHSAYLSQDIGTVLTTDILKSLIDKYDGIEGVCIMGGSEEEVIPFFHYVKKKFPVLFTAWYTGDDEVSSDTLYKCLDYIKIGHYDETLGGLESKTTNQKLYVKNDENSPEKWKDITYKFWKGDDR